jgi:hypothetical protein
MIATFLPFTGTSKQVMPASVHRGSGPRNLLLWARSTRTAPAFDLSFPLPFQLGQRIATAAARIPDVLTDKGAVLQEGAGGTLPSKMRVGRRWTNGLTKWGLVASVAALWLGCGTGSRRTPAQHRVDAAQCSTPVGPGNCGLSGSDCANDASCADGGLNARCIEAPGPAICSCTIDACVTDSDCPQGQTCACHGSPYTYSFGNQCVPSNCRVDADCGPGGFCSPSVASQCGPGAGDFCLGYYCHTPKDTCTNDADCGAAKACIYSYSASAWQCVPYFPPG